MPEQPKKPIKEPEPTDQITKQDALDLLDRWEKAMAEKDSALLGKVLHPQFQYAGNADGTLTNRRGMMEGIVAEDFSFLGQEFFSTDIKLYDDVAIVRGWEILKLGIS